MQTFLPYYSFIHSARALDRARLGKQRIEAFQILTILVNKRHKKNVAWSHHPAVLMWAGYEYSLALYGLYMCMEWRKRGYRDTMYECFEKLMKRIKVDEGMPPWLGREVFHRSHRSNLLRKMPGHYRKFWPKLRDDLPYWWPSKHMV
jgi:hypothetical protein